MNTLQIHRTHYNGRRHCNCGFDCKQNEEGIWKVHFWGDYLPSEDFYSVDGFLFSSIEDRHDKWVAAMDARK